MAEISGDRLLEPAFVLGNRGTQPRQPIEPFTERRRGLCTRQIVHAVKSLMQGVLARAFEKLVHRISRRSRSRKLAFQLSCGKSNPGGRFCATKAGFRLGLPA